MTYRLTQEEAVGILHSWLYEYGLPGVNMNASGNSPAEIVDRWHQEELRRAKSDAWHEGFEAGWEEHENPGPFVNDIWDAKTPNPYRSKP